MPYMWIMFVCLCLSRRVFVSVPAVFILVRECLQGVDFVCYILIQAYPTLFNRILILI